MYGEAVISINEVKGMYLKVGFDRMLVFYRGGFFFVVLDFCVLCEN